VEALELDQSSRAYERLYPIQDQGGGYFWAGRLPGDRQVLITRSGVALIFDASGALIGCEERTPPGEAPRQADSGEAGQGGQLDTDPSESVLEQL
jgi:hypothetical protein